jgi:hypothetical protein
MDPQFDSTMPDLRATREWQASREYAAWTAFHRTRSAARRLGVEQDRVVNVVLDRLYDDWQAALSLVRATDAAIAEVERRSMRRVAGPDE